MPYSLVQCLRGPIFSSRSLEELGSTAPASRAHCSTARSFRELSSQTHNFRARRSGAAQLQGASSTARSFREHCYMAPTFKVPRSKRRSFREHGYLAPNFKVPRSKRRSFRVHLSWPHNSRAPLLDDAQLEGASLDGAFVWRAQLGPGFFPIEKSLCPLSLPILGLGAGAERALYPEQYDKRNAWTNDTYAALRQNIEEVVREGRDATEALNRVAILDCARQGRYSRILRSRGRSARTGQRVEENDRRSEHR